MPFVADPGTQTDYTKPVQSFTTGTDEKFVRFYNLTGNSGELGSWVMKESDIVGLSPAQIKNKYALPEMPTHIVDVIVPKDTKVYKGTAGKVVNDGVLWGNGGGSQFQLQTRIPAENYTNSRPIQ